jgi:hypothetical protein
VRRPISCPHDILNQVKDERTISGEMLLLE